MPIPFIATAAGAWVAGQQILKAALPANQSAKVISDMSPLDLGVLTGKVAVALLETGYNRGVGVVQFFAPKLAAAGVSKTGVYEFNGQMFKALGNNMAGNAWASWAADRRVWEAKGLDPETGKPWGAGGGSGGGGSGGGAASQASMLPWVVAGALVLAALALRRGR